MQGTVRTLPTATSPPLWKRSVRAGLAILLVLTLPLLAARFPTVLGQADALVVTDDAAHAGLRSGDVVFVEPATPRELRVGDLVTLRDPGEPSRLMVSQVTDPHAGAQGVQVQVGHLPDPVDAGTVVGRVSIVLPAYGHLLHPEGTVSGATEALDALSARLPGS